MPENRQKLRNYQLFAALLEVAQEFGHMVAPSPAK
jgi:hypothetical protein